MSKYFIGDIVSLRTHPFSELSNNIIISGEHLMTPPTMVISEIISRTSEDDGEHGDRYKCTWFSSKKNDFPQHWFTDSDLKPVKIPPIEQVIPITQGGLVSLKNLRIEMGKRRSYLQTDSKLTGGKTQTNSISAHMVFISPVMLVTEIKDCDLAKLPKGISKKDKIFPSQIVKCKYYNAAQEKYSEVLLPIEVLVALPIVDDSQIETIQGVINQSSYMLTDNRILKPLNIYCKSGIYFLGAYDPVQLRNTDIELTQLEEFKVIKSPFLNTAPNYNVKITEGAKHLEQDLDVEEYVRKLVEEPEKKFVFIKYIDKYGNNTHRTVHSYDIVLGPGEGDSPTQVEYLRAHCNLRNATRHFRLKGIIEASRLALSYPLSIN